MNSAKADFHLIRDPLAKASGNKKLVHLKSLESSDIRLNPTSILNTDLSRNLPLASAHCH